MAYLDQVNQALKNLDDNRAQQIELIEKIKKKPELKIDSDILDKMKSVISDDSKYQVYRQKYEAAHWFNNNGTKVESNEGQRKVDLEKLTQEWNKAIGDAADNLVVNGTDVRKQMAKDAKKALADGSGITDSKFFGNVVEPTWEYGKEQLDSTGGKIGLGLGGIAAFAAVASVWQNESSSWWEKALVVLAVPLLLLLGAMGGNAAHKFAEKQSWLDSSDKGTSTPTTPAAAKEADVKLTVTGDKVTGTSKVDGVEVDLVGVVDDFRNNKITIKEIYDKGVAATDRVNDNSNDKLKTDLITDVDASSITMLNTPITDKMRIKS